MGILNNIVDLREKFGLTQQDLAHHVGVSRQTINSIERGKFEPSLSLALRIARYFSKNVESIFRNNENY